MKQSAIKVLAAGGLIMIRVASVLLPLYLIINALTTLEPSPYALYAAVVGIPSVLFLERAYSRFWHSNWGNKSQQNTSNVAYK